MLLPYKKISAIRESPKAEYTPISQVILTNIKMPIVSNKDTIHIILDTTRVSLCLIQLKSTKSEIPIMQKHNGKGAKQSGPGIHLSLAALSLDPFSQTCAFNTQAVPYGLTSQPKGQISPSITHYRLLSGANPLGHVVTHVKSYRY